MDKFCIFCGKPPENKNKEHVIPKWLIELTGDPNRVVRLGRKWTSKELEKREFTFSSLTFPACARCNEEYGTNLEGKTIPIVNSILSKSSISASDWDIFFDWLDKVRIGLWLGFFYLNENYQGIEPMFHINKRMGSKDRLLIIYEIIPDEQTGIMWSCTESPLFAQTQSCFTLTINNFLFLNASYDFLISERIGWPYPDTRQAHPTGKTLIDVNDGAGKIQFPLIEKKFKSGGTQLFQPIIPYEHCIKVDGEDGDLADVYDNDYVRSTCLNFETGKGKIFRRNRNQLDEYPIEPSDSWLPKERFPRGEVHYETSLLAGEFLEDLYRDVSTLELLDSKEAERIKKDREGAMKLHRAIMDLHRKQKDLYY